jgi:hypothetical protein
MLKTAVETGWVSDGCFAFVGTAQDIEAICKVVSAAGYSGPDRTISEDKMRSFCESAGWEDTPASIVGTAVLEGYGVVLKLRSGLKFAVIQAVYYHTILDRWSDAEMRLSLSPKTQPMIFLAGGVVVGVVMPLRDPEVTTPWLAYNTP